MKFVSPVVAWRRSSLRTRLMLWNVFALAWILAIMGGLIQYTVKTNLIATIDRDLKARTKPPPGGMRSFRDAFAGQPGEPGPNPPPENPPNERDQPPPERTDSGGPQPPVRLDHPRGRPEQGPYHPHIFDLQGHNFRADTPQTPWSRASFEQALNGKEDSRDSAETGESLRIYSRPIREQGRVTAVVQNAYPLADVNLAITGMNRALLTLIPVALLLAGLGGAALTDRALRPVRHITRTAEQIGAQALSRRLPVVGGDEFARLAATFNGMLTRLETAFIQKETLVTQLEELVAQQQRFTGDASHELRTPLTVIKANTSLLLPGQPTQEEYREAIEDIDRAANAMTRLVHDLLLLTRSDGGQLGRNATVLSAADVLERARYNVRTPDAAPITLEIADPDLRFFGNADELTRLFSNLLENAARYTPPNGEIRLTAQSVSERIQICVADTGVGIAPEHLPHLCERFYRVDAARSRPDGGTGLGLAICKSIAEAHGGTLEIASELGKGTTVTVTLPRAESA